MATGWRSDILVSIRSRDLHEKANIRMINEFTKLADRTISVASDHNTLPATPSDQNTEATDTSSKDAKDMNQLRLDLSEAQQRRNLLESKVKALMLELASVKETAEQSGKEAARLSVDRGILEKKVRDRDDEVKGHKKIIENLQDEILTLNIQLDLADQAKSRVIKENQDLIARWMAHKAEEAEKMNNASNFS